MGIILDAFKEEIMYGIEISETDQMLYSFDARGMPMFARSSLWLLSAFCILSTEGEIDILWVHSRCRCMGIGSLFVKYFKIRRFHLFLKARKDSGLRMVLSVELIQNQIQKNEMKSSMPR